MPARKSNISTTSLGPEEVESTPAKASKDKDGLSVEDLSLPKSMIARLAKGVLPANTQIHKDALLALHKSATVFVSYIASNSNDNAQASGKKTISPQDVIAALKDAELGEFLPRLEAELKKYNDTQCDKRNSYRRKVKEEKAAAAAKDGAQEAPTGGESAENDKDVVNGHAEAERPVKKMKRENGNAAVPEVQSVEEDGDDEGDEESDEEADGVAGEDNEGEVDEDEEDGDEDDEATEGDEGDEDEEEDDDDEGPDETMEDPLEEADETSALQERDEALDEPDSD